MTVKKLLEAFVNGATRGKASGGRLRINGAKLYNYDTVIALRKKDGTVAVNNNYYSQTTSRHQNYLKALLWGTDYKEASEISIRKMLEEGC